MNVLHIAAHLGAGAGKAIGGLAISDKANKHKILILCEPQKLNHIEKCRKNNVPVIYRDHADFNADLFKWADIVVYSWWGHKIFDEFMEEYPVDSQKSILWAHVNGVFAPKPSQFLLEQFKHYMVTSQISIEEGVFSREKTSLVYGFGDFNVNGIAAKPNYSMQSDDFIIGFVGSMNYNKLSSYYLEYCEKVIERLPKVKFVMIGEINQTLMQDAKNRGISDFFDFHGWADDILGWMGRFDVFGYPMNPETFATTENVILEALASGLPTVVSRQPLGKYQIEDGESGFLFDSPAEYADIMCKLALDERLRKNIGCNAKKYAAEKYNLAKNIETFNKAIQKTLYSNGSVKLT